METRFFRKLTGREWGEYWDYRRKRFSELTWPDVGRANGRPYILQQAKDRIWEEFIQVLEKRDELNKGNKLENKPKVKSIWD